MPFINSIGGSKGFGRGRKGINYGSFVTSDLFIHFDFSNPACYSGSGSTVIDLAGTQNGTINNATFGGNKRLRYFDFERDAQNNYIQLGSSIPAGQSTSELTMEAWVWVESVAPGSLDNGLGGIWSSQYDALQNGASIATDGRNGAHGGTGPESLHYQLGINSSFTTNSSFGNSEGGTGSPAGWMHVVATRDSSGNKRIYRNGMLVGNEGTFAGSITWANTYWLLGAEPNGGTYRRFFDGKIAIARVYNKALTASEVLNNFDGQKFRFGYRNYNEDLDVFEDSSGIAYWKFDNNANDVSGNYNGTASNVTFTTDSKFGTHSAVFNGSTSNISIPTVKNSYPFSVSMWVTHNSSWNPGDGFDQLMNLNIAGQRISLGIVANSGWRTGPAIFYGGSNHWSGFGPNAGGDTANTTWHHLCYVIYGSNDSRHKIYLDGYPVDLANNGGAHGGVAGWAIGSNGNGSEYWPGKIDEARFFNRELTGLEVTALANGGRVRSFNYTGGNQSWTVPAGVSLVSAYLWGAAGGGANAEGFSDAGGPGGFTSGNILVSPGQTIVVQVGQGGEKTDGGGTRPPRPYPNGGLPSVRTGYISGAGGGRSALFLESFSVENTLLVAGGGAGAAGHGGGGGSSGVNMAGGSGGGSVAGGGSGYTFPNVERIILAGTQSAGGSNISSRPFGRNAGQFIGGDAGNGQLWSAGFNAAGGGGDGWYGGGTIDDEHAGGGGGSGYFNPTLAPGTSLEKTAFSAGKKTSIVPPNDKHPGYVSGIAVGTANQIGGNGRVVIFYD